MNASPHPEPGLDASPPERPAGSMKGRIPRLETVRRTLTLAAILTAAFIVLMSWQTLLSLWGAGVRPLWAAGTVAVLGIVMLILIYPMIKPAFHDSPRSRNLVVAATAVVVTAVILSPNGGEFLAIIWLMGLAAILSLRATLIVAAAVYVIVLAWSTIFSLYFMDERFLEGMTTSDHVFAMVFSLYSMAMWTAAPVALMRALVWVWRCTQEAYAGREAQAKLAVSEERLRFARDLHDLLGHSLSVIALKSELAAKLRLRDPAAADAEMAEVRRLARDSLKEVRAAVQGYRKLDLDAELASVRAVLEAAGIRCVITAETGGLSEETRTLLAWAVREGATNILKHSTAERCDITIADGVLEIRNDGVRQNDDGPGSGLHGLTERLLTAGGSMSAGSTGAGEFVLRAAVPS